MRNRRDDERGFRWTSQDEARGRGGARERGYGYGYGERRYEEERARYLRGGRGGFERGGYGGYERSGYGGSTGYRTVPGPYGMGYPEREGIEARGPHYGKGPKGYRRSDERIREDVCETIAQQGYIDASDVEVKVENAIVTLSGTVTHRQEKRALEQMVERVHGVDEVQNELHLRREERTSPAPTPEEPRARMPGQPQQGQNGRSSRA